MDSGSTCAHDVWTVEVRGYLALATCEACGLRHFRAADEVDSLFRLVEEL